VDGPNGPLAGNVTKILLHRDMPGRSWARPRLPFARPPVNNV